MAADVGVVMVVIVVNNLINFLSFIKTHILGFLFIILRIHYNEIRDKLNNNSHVKLRFENTIV